MSLVLFSNCALHMLLLLVSKNDFYPLGGIKLTCFLLKKKQATKI